MKVCNMPPKQERGTLFRPFLALTLLFIWYLYVRPDAFFYRHRLPHASLRMPLQLSLRGAKRRGNLQHYDPVRLPRRFAPRNDVIGYEYSLKQGPTRGTFFRSFLAPTLLFIWYLYVHPGVSPDAFLFLLKKFKNLTRVI